MTERLNLKSCEILFDPPTYQKPRRSKRSVRVMLKDGRIVSGITIRYPKGAAERIEIPGELVTENRPEWGNPKVTLSELDRDALRLRIQDECRYHPGDKPPPELSRPGESVRLLRKARASRSGHRN